MATPGHATSYDTEAHFADVEEAVLVEVDPPETVLLKPPHEDRLLPLSTFAFGISQGSRARVQRVYVGSFVVYRDGVVTKIEDIAFLGLWGVTVPRRMFNALNGGTSRIAVEVSPQPQFGLAAIKELVLRYLPEDRLLPESVFLNDEPLERVLQQVRVAASCSEVFAAIGVPAADDVLDILCTP